MLKRQRIHYLLCATGSVKKKNQSFLLKGTLSSSRCPIAKTMQMSFLTLFCSLDSELLLLIMGIPCLLDFIVWASKKLKLLVYLYRFFFFFKRYAFFFECVCFECWSIDSQVFSLLFTKEKKNNLEAEIICRQKNGKKGRKSSTDQQIIIHPADE